MMFRVFRKKQCACDTYEHCDLKKECVYLNDVRKNTSVTLEELCNNRRLKQKLRDMGLTKGVEFKVVNNSNDGPVVVNLRGSKLALGHGMSKKIMVREIR